MCIADDWDIVILPDAVEALAPSHKAALLRLSKRKIYGFLGGDKPLGARERLTFMFACGAMICSIGCRNDVVNHVRVLWCEPNSIRPIPLTKSELSWKRENIWQNDERNDVVADLATAIVANDFSQVRELVSNEMAQRLPSVQKSVSIIVEVPEHGRQLLRRLPGWRLLEQKQPLQHVDWNGHHRTITTIRRFKELSCLDANVVIRADGTPWPLIAEAFPPADALGRRIAAGRFRRRFRQGVERGMRQSRR